MVTEKPDNNYKNIAIKTKKKQPRRQVPSDNDLYGRTVSSIPTKDPYQTLQAAAIHLLLSTCFNLIMRLNTARVSVVAKFISEPRWQFRISWDVLKTAVVDTNVLNWIYSDILLDDGCCWKVYNSSWELYDSVLQFQWQAILLLSIISLQNLEVSISKRCREKVTWFMNVIKFYLSGTMNVKLYCKSWDFMLY